MTGRSQVVLMSREGPWVAAPFCFPQTGQRQNKIDYCQSKRMYVGETPHGKRVVALVTLGVRGPNRTTLKRPGRLRAFWMDAVTGTLYQLKTGIAISSEETFLWDIRKDESEVLSLINKKFSIPSG